VTILPHDATLAWYSVYAMALLSVSVRLFDVRLSDTSRCSINTISCKQRHYLWDSCFPMAKALAKFRGGWSPRLGRQIYMGWGNLRVFTNNSLYFENGRR